MQTRRTPVTFAGMDDDFLERLREAAEADAEDGDASSFDLLGTAKGEAPVDASPDLTLRGYVETHDRPPAFEGVDGQPYTVAVDTEPAEDGDGWVAFLVFIRWAATGAGIMGHVESGDVASADTEDAARDAAMKLTLYDLKTELDAAIRRREERLES